MHNIEITNIIETFDSLPIEDKEYTFQLIEKNLTVSKRETLINMVKEAEINFNSGNIIKGGLKELLEDLEDD